MLNKKTLTMGQHHPIIQGLLKGTGVACLVLSSQVGAVDLKGTVFERAAQAHQIDPVLLYSVGLAESSYARGNGNISPWPWTIRTPDGPIYKESRAEIEQTLQEQLAIYGEKSSIDVGMLQVNLRWNGDRVESPAVLLDPEQAAFTGAQLLKEALDSAPGDMELAVGRYHHWKHERISRDYGRRVLAIYNSLTDNELAGGQP